MATSRNEQSDDDSSSVLDDGSITDSTANVFGMALYTMKVRPLTIFLFLFLFLWTGVAIFTTSIVEYQARLNLAYEERLARMHNRHTEIDGILEALHYLNSRIDSNESAISVISCQQDMIMAAARSGWRYAERIMRTGLMMTCREGKDRS